jgi:hypothetical protein
MPPLAAACLPGDSWPARTAAAIFAAFDFAATNPAAARVLLIESLGSGEDGLDRRRRLLADFTARLALGRSQRPEGVQLPSIVEQFLIGGLVNVITQRLLSEQPESSLEIASGMVEFTLLPYLGADEAKRWAAATSPGA